jgi:hypothetical protein
MRWKHTAAITFALLLTASPIAISQNFLGLLPTDSLLGRDTAGTGQVESITLDDTLSFDGSKHLQRDALTGDVTSSAGSQATTIAGDSVALTTDTTGNYAAGDAEAGAALTGDSATSFFSAGTIELARGGTSASLSDPAGHRLLVWDDTNNVMEFQDGGTGLTTSATALDCDTPTTTAVGCIELATTAEATAMTDTSRAVTPEGLKYKPIYMCMKVGDETTAITTGTGKLTFYFPAAWTVTGVYAALTAQSTSGNPTFDINEAGTSILGANKLSIDANEDTSATAATGTSVSDASIAANAKMTIDIDTAGTGAKGPEICITGNPT